VGSGPVARRGDRAAIKCVAFDMKPTKSRTGTGGPRLRRSRCGWGADKYSRGLDEGIEEMRVGGRRELIIPSRLAFEEGAIIYGVVKPAGS
jgi:hypothetical protein